MILKMSKKGASGTSVMGSDNARLSGKSRGSLNQNGSLAGAALFKLKRATRDGELHVANRDTGERSPVRAMQ